MTRTSGFDPGAALDLLQSGASTARSDPARSEVALKEALRLAPGDFDVRLGAYRFYFYNHQYRDALPHCEALIGHAARRLNIASDWRRVAPEDADFTEPEFAPGLFLQTLLAWGYCQLRLGEFGLARQALSHCATLDPTDRFGAAAILGHLEARERDEDACS